MESTGIPNRIHISRKTAEQLKREKKEKWVVERSEFVTAKGKGILQTFFAEPNVVGTPSSPSTADDTSSTSRDDLEASKDSARNKEKSLIDWNVILLAELLKKVVAHNLKTTKSTSASLSISGHSGGCSMVRDEVLDTIALPTYEAQDDQKAPAVEDVDLGDEVMEQLHSYVSAIASCYPPNVSFF